MELAICEPDPELSALISGGLLLRKNLGTVADPNNKSIGWAAPGVGDDPAGNGVSIEAWSHAVKDGKRTAVLPYFYWVFPYVKMRQSGDRVIENGLMANTFEGYGLGNANFKSGIDGRWEFPVATERPYAYARSDWAPTGLSGFYTWTDNATDQVVFTSANASSPSVITVDSFLATLTDTTASLTFSEPPLLQVGDVISVQNVGSLFNGDKTVSGVSGNVVSYLNSAITQDILSTPVTRGARVTTVNSLTESFPYPVATTSINSGGAGYNVPGAVGYDEYGSIDNVIASNENPS
jgi:hypothetical protein